MASTCIACLGSDGVTAVECSSNHIICDACVENFPEDQWPPRCPQCAELLGEQYLLDALPVEKKCRLENLRLVIAKKAAVNDGECIVECQTCSIYAAVRGKMDSLDVFQCYHPNCFASTCTHGCSSRFAFKTDHTTCKLANDIRQALIPVRCPNCDVPVVKEADGGCNQMKCVKCGCVFCYVCESKLNDINDIHGGYSVHYNQPNGCKRLLVEYFHEDPESWPEDEKCRIEKLHEQKISLRMTDLLEGILVFDDTSLAIWKTNLIDIISLLQHKADVNVRSKTLPWMSPLHCAAIADSKDAIRILVRFGSILNHTPDPSPLHEAAVVKNSASAISLLVNLGADLEATGPHNRTPLHGAAGSGRIDAVKMLVECGANLHARDSDGRTPLHEATIRGHVDIIRFLIELGANLLIKDYEGKSPIHFAAGEGSADIICILVNLSADIESVDEFGRTPLYYAAGFGHVCAISLLDELGADFRVKDRIGRTPLHYAAKNGHVDVIRFLAEHAADFHARDTEGLTPIGYATQRQSPRAARAFVEYGTAVNFGS